METCGVYHYMEGTATNVTSFPGPIPYEKPKRGMVALHVKSFTAVHVIKRAVQ